MRKSRTFFSPLNERKIEDPHTCSSPSSPSVDPCSPSFRTQQGRQRQPSENFTRVYEATVGGDWQPCAPAETGVYLYQVGTCAGAGVHSLSRVPGAARGWPSASLTPGGRQEPCHPIPKWQLSARRPLEFPLCSSPGWRQQQVSQHLWVGGKCTGRRGGKFL